MIITGAGTGIGSGTACYISCDVATEIRHTLEDTMAAERDTCIDWIIEQSVTNGQLLTPRKGRADEIAAAIAFPASDEASYITARNLSVDGGMDWCW